MVLRGRLRKPDVTGVAGKLPAFERANDSVSVADFAAGRIHEIGAAFHLREQRIVEASHLLGNAVACPQVDLLPAG